MTPNHGHTPADDRRKEQGSPDQQPAGQQSPHQPQTGQPAQSPQQGQWTQQGRQSGIRQVPIQQGQPTQQGQPIQQGQPSQQGQPTQQSQPTQLGAQQTPPPRGSGGPTQRSQPVQQPQQPTTGTIRGQQQMRSQPETQPSQAGGQSQYQQPTGVQPQQQPQRPGPRQPLLKPIRVNEIITEDLVTADRDTPVRTLVAQMAEHDVGSVVVVEEDRPIGIITDRKVALALEEMPDIAQRTAEDLLSGDVFTADPSMSIFDAIDVMSDEGIRRLPIVDDNGALRGIVTLDDTLVLLGGVVSEVAETVQAQSSRL